MTRLLVADASVFLSLLFLEPKSDEAEKLLAAHLRGTIVLQTIDLAYVEVASAISRRCRSNRITAAHGKTLWGEFRSWGPEPVEARGILTDSLRISVLLNQSLYDCAYLALAVRLECELVTADERFCNSVRHRYPNVKLL